MCEDVPQDHGYCGDKYGKGCGANLLNAEEEENGYCRQHPNGLQQAS